MGAPAAALSAYLAAVYMTVGTAGQLREDFRTRALWSGSAVPLLGWGVAQWPYLLYPHLTVWESAASAATINAVLQAVPVGLALVRGPPVLVEQNVRRVLEVADHAYPDGVGSTWPARRPHGWYVLLAACSFRARAGSTKPPWAC